MPVTKSWVYQRNILRKNYNPTVLEYFADLGADDGDFSSGRKALRQACLIKPKDGQQMVLHKMGFFYNVILEVHNQPSIYGIPVASFKENITIFPQITCHFKERDDIAKVNNRRPLTAQCSIRFKGDVSSKGELESLGRKIKSIFGSGSFHFSKGRQKYTYYDAENSIKLDGFFTSESDAKSLFDKMLVSRIFRAGPKSKNRALLHKDFRKPKSVVRINKDTNDKMLDIQSGMAYHDRCLSVGTKPHFDWTPNDPEVIAGKSVKSPQQRVPGEVYFTHAELKHKKLKEDIILYAATPQRRRQSLI